MRCLATFFAAIGLLLPAAHWQRPAASADLVVRNGSILTVDAKFSVAQALAVKDGKFVFVGDDGGVRSWIGQSTVVLDARGKSVLPGLIDSHVHSVGVGNYEVTNRYQELRSIAEIQDWIRRAAARKKPGEWILAPRNYPTRIRERRFPTRAELDAATTRHPVLFDGAYSHVLNTRAMEKCNLSKNSPAPKVGEIVRDAQGNPTGLLRNARSYLNPCLPEPDVSRQQTLDALEKVHLQYVKAGLTSVTERGASLAEYRLYQELKRQGRLHVRSRVTIRLGATTGPEAEKFIRALPVSPAQGDDWLGVGPLKITVDGGILIGTAYMRQPYGQRAASLYNLTDPDYRGSLALQPGNIKELIRTGHQLGWQMTSHVTGDAGVDLVLDALEAANRDKAIAPARFNLMHAYFANPDTIERARRLGVVLDTQPAWYYKDADALESALGPERMERFLAVDRWARAGVPVVINTDHMLGMDSNTALNPFNPFLTLYTVVTRKTEAGMVIGGDDRKIARPQALRMMTSNAAFMSFDEEKKGSIEVGKLGDLIVLSENYLTCPADKIKDIQVMATVIGGKVVYKK